MKLKAQQKRRLDEMRQDKQQERDVEAQRAQLQQEMGAELEAWARHKRVHAMLSSLHNFPDLFPAGSTPVLSSPDKCDNAELGKAYKKALKRLHPDRLRNKSLREKVQGEELFKLITDAYAAHMKESWSSPDPVL